MLWAALPIESRTVRRMLPDAQWSQTDYILASIEHLAALNLWAKTKDGERGRNAPKPRQTPGERARNRQNAESAMELKARMAKELGIED